MMSHLSHSEDPPGGGAEDLYLDQNLVAGQEQKYKYKYDLLFAHRSYSCVTPWSGLNYPAALSWSCLYPINAGALAWGLGGIWKSVCKMYIYICSRTHTYIIIFLFFLVFRDHIYYYYVDRAQS